MRNTIIHLFILIFIGSSSFAADYTEESVIIDATLEEVWDYNANNENARNWSVYFYKIVDCPLDECQMNINLASSDIGFTRRCYRNEDESGIYWDETTLEISKSKKLYYKKMRAHNFNGYPKFMGFNKRGEYIVEQFYEKLEDGKTKLTFRSTLMPRKSLEKKTGKILYFKWKFIEFLATKNETAKIFAMNLENIKLAIENAHKYQRKHQFMLSD